MNSRPFMPLFFLIGSLKYAIKYSLFSFFPIILQDMGQKISNSAGPPDEFYRKTPEAAVLRNLKKAAAAK